MSTQFVKLPSGKIFNLTNIVEVHWIFEYSKTLSLTGNDSDNSFLVDGEDAQYLYNVICMFSKSYTFIDDEKENENGNQAA